MATSCLEHAVSLCLCICLTHYLRHEVCRSHSALKLSVLLARLYRIKLAGLKRILIFQLGMYRSNRYKNGVWKQEVTYPIHGLESVST